ncbi:hypothetical protein Rsub_00080 [Raphidocelis subcapitata]|uniref:Uncharacterized protein n=1 Tax=Raphidocelis subcapitata TaxID=307507 RepID=A0A2V0NK67_9CHLO|nr:hypothetical protein Rsub_00080 [Raphidocelis subcapitata]|eukprot:GBF87369.1 hypothetical protein Rsub_00080 [Raphidocelis subcapitata]
MGEAFETFSLSLAFPSGFPDATVADLNRAIVRLQTQQGALENTYIKTGGTDKCFSGSGGGHASGAQIKLRQVSGLWYILCFATGACFVMTGAYNLRKNPVHANRLRSFRNSLPGSRIARVAAENAASGAGAPGRRKAPPPRLQTQSGADDAGTSPQTAGGTPLRQALGSGGGGGGGQRIPGAVSFLSESEAAAATQQHQHQQQQQQQQPARRPPELPRPERQHPTSSEEEGDEVLELTPTPSHAGHSLESPHS